MGDLDAELFGGDGAGHGGVDVADHDDQVGLLLPGKPSRKRP